MEEEKSKFDSELWIDYLNHLKDRDWNHQQRNCFPHAYQKVPHSGKHLGISLWKCVFCEGVIQAN